MTRGRAAQPKQWADGTQEGEVCAGSIRRSER